MRPVSVGGPFFIYTVQHICCTVKLKTHDSVRALYPRRIYITSYSITTRQNFNVEEAISGKASPASQNKSREFLNVPRFRIVVIFGGRSALWMCCSFWVFKRHIINFLSFIHLLFLFPTHCPTVLPHLGVETSLICNYAHKKNHYVKGFARCCNGPTHTGTDCLMIASHGYYECLLYCGGLDTLSLGRCYLRQLFI